VYAENGGGQVYIISLGGKGENIMTRKEELLKAYTEQGTDAKSITLMISMPTGETEIITNPNVAEKIAYIEKTYDDDLIHSGCKKIIITEYGFTFKTEGMDFGSALLNLKEGHRLARGGWNGKGMFLYYVPASSYPPATKIARIAFDGKDVPYGAYIAMKTAQGNVIPWLASQTDMLAEDWVVI